MKFYFIKDEVKLETEVEFLNAFIKLKKKFKTKKNLQKRKYYSLIRNWNCIF